jgi:hypothetical protein
VSKKIATQGPYGQIFNLQSPLEQVESWNHTDGSLTTIPAGEAVRVLHVYDSSSTTIQSCREEGLEVRCPADGKSSIGYRFIVNNVALSKAIGVQLPVRTRDLVGEIIAYENGQAAAPQTRRLFRTLRRTGLGKGLQGHYSSRM